MLLAAANRALRAEGVKPPDLMGMLDLVALATVADVAPLVGLNRALVRQGLKVMAGRRSAGLRALADAARLTGPPSAYHLGFAARAARQRGRAHRRRRSRRAAALHRRPGMRPRRWPSGSTT
jgi:single-stranded DNA-specific DHH superfamily exonuclease